MPAVHRFLLLALTALLVPSAALSAQTNDADDPPPDTIFRIGGIDVRAERAVAESGGATALEVELEDLDLPAAATIAEVFREIPALLVRTNSRGQAEISVRGSESRQVAIRLDGVPLTLSWDARTDVSVLPSTALSTVRFVRGLGTVLGGTNVLGGVVDLDLFGSATPDAPPTLALGIDQFGGWSASGALTRGFADGRGTLRLGAGARDTPAMPLPGDVAERPEAESGRRLNTDFANLDGFVAARYRSDSGAWSSASLTAHRSDRGIAAELGTDAARFWRYPETTRAIASLRAGTGDRSTALGRGAIEGGVSLDVGREEIVSYADAGYDRIDDTEQGRGRTITARLRAMHSLGDRGEVRTSLDAGFVRHEEETSEEVREFEQRFLSTGLEAEWALLQRAGAFERLTVSVGGVWDRASTPVTGGLPSLGTLDEWGGRLGLSALANGGRTLFHAGLSRRGRFPSLRETYSEALARFLPNPDLRPERLVALEAGVTTAFGAGEVQLVGFRHDVSGAIRRITLDGGLRQRVNADDLVSTGVELFVNQQFGSLSAGGDIRIQAVELTDPGRISREPENVPEREGTLWGEWSFDSGMRVRGEAEYTGAQFCQDPGDGRDVELDGGTWLNAVVSRVWDTGRGTWQRLETTLRATNLTDTALYDQCGLPRPGRGLSLQMSLF
jgi:hypothetical protein